MFLFSLTRNGIFLCEGTHHKLRSFHLTLVASWKKKIFTGQREHFHVSRGWCMNTTDYGLMKQNAASHLFTSHERRTSLCRTYIRYQDTKQQAGLAAWFFIDPVANPEHFLLKLWTPPCSLPWSSLLKFLSTIISTAVLLPWRRSFPTPIHRAPGWWFVASCLNRDEIMED